MVYLDEVLDFIPADWALLYHLGALYTRCVVLARNEHAVLLGLITNVASVLIGERLFLLYFGSWRQVLRVHVPIAHVCASCANLKNHPILDRVSVALLHFLG